MATPPPPPPCALENSARESIPHRRPDLDHAETPAQEVNRSGESMLWGQPRPGYCSAHVPAYPRGVGAGWDSGPFFCSFPLSRPPPLEWGFLRPPAHLPSRKLPGLGLKGWEFFPLHLPRPLGLPPPPDPPLAYPHPPLP